MRNKPKPKENKYGYNLPEVTIKAKRLNKRNTLRDINDNPAVQIAKIFDPTGISSWPDVKYAYDDYKKGIGSAGNVALNVLGALPVLGKAKAPLSLFKLANATRKQKAILKTLDTVTKVGDKVADIERTPVETIAKLTDSATKPLAKTVNKTSRAVLKLSDDVGEFTRKQINNTVLKKRTTPGFSTKAIPAEKIANTVTSSINTANFTTDVNSALNSVKNQSNKYEKGGWIQKATASIKKRGTEVVCTGSKFGSASCPEGSRRYILAQNFKRMAAKRKN